MNVERLFGSPIITSDLSPSIGDNINGATLIQVPDWVPHKLGNYYLYFAHHTGRFIRLAYSDTLKGPWKIYEPGVLHLESFPYLEQREGIGHIASPDIYIDHDKHQIIMYYHGLLPTGDNISPASLAMLAQARQIKKQDYDQNTYVALSQDGLHFESKNEIIGGYYFRVFRYKGYFYSLEMYGQVRRSRNGIDNFEMGPQLFKRWDMRHCALLRRGDTLYVFHTIRGTAPESIVVSTIDLSQDWLYWQESDYELVLKPETDYEGADLPVTKSALGPSRGRENQLRDPYIYEEDGHLYLLYSIAGENGIAIAEIFL